MILKIKDNIDESITFFNIFEDGIKLIKRIGSEYMDDDDSYRFWPFNDFIEACMGDGRYEGEYSFEILTDEEAFLEML